MTSKKKILITVGTTQFESLVKYVDSEEFLTILDSIDQRQTNYDQISYKNLQILCQIGSKGQYIPKVLKHIRLSDKISEIYNQSDFIICHGGAGTLLENLRNQKKIIAVANDTLAGNHQVELINKLAKENYLLGFESVDQLKKNPNLIKQFFLGQIKFKEYEKVSKSVLNEIIFGQK